jgi:Ca2+-binding RTX toxin-like protein
MQANSCGYEMRGSQLETLSNSSYESPHEGYSGWWAYHFIGGNANGPRKIEDTVDIERPDVLLLHIGSNDLNGTGGSNSPVSVDQALDHIRQVVNKINSKSDTLGIPRPVILLAQPIPWFGESQDDDGDGIGDNPDIAQDIEELGDKIAVAISNGFPVAPGSGSREAPLSNLYEVDAFSGFTQQMMQADLIHPNPSGEQYLANRFFLGMVNAGLCTYATNQCNGLTVDVDIGNGDVPTPGDDVILGTSGADTINGLGGNDTICGLGGNDIINAGGGNDWVDGGDGNDDIQGTAGSDEIYGGPGDDVIRGGSGDDEIYGEEGDDSLMGQPGNDIIDGASGVDEINGGGGNDTIYTGSGATVGSGVFVTGSVGNDTIYGGPDADDIKGSNGADTIFGEAGDDVITGGDGRDEVHGGDGSDNIKGQEARDMINGDAGNDVINGGDENDTVNGGAGDDSIAGGPGDDVLRGDSGADDIKGGSGDDTLVGGASSGDSCNGQSGADSAAASCEVTSGIP